METTHKATGTVNGYDYVDLGLSVKWATINVGASKPEDNGNYYAWGEIERKNIYNYLSYKFRASGDTWDDVIYNKYNTNIKHGPIDNKTILDPEDDVAHIMWGDCWRMPTKKEQEELLNNCTWIWTTVNGKNGYMVTSKLIGYTDRSIFLPAAGFCMTNYPYYYGRVGYYWSSSLDSDRPNRALCIRLTTSELFISDKHRPLYGFSIRPVYP